MRRLICALALFMAGTAQAAVYTWETVSSPIEAPIAGRMDLTSWDDYSHSCTEGHDFTSPCEGFDPNSPLRSFKFGFSQTGLDIEPPTGRGFMYMEVVNISADALYIEDGAVGTWFTRDGDLWSLTFVHEGYVFPTITGRWLQQQEKVPLPGTLALLGLGALLFRRKTVTPPCT